MSQNNPLRDALPPLDLGHGHVRPNKNGLKARCGGPAICNTCRKELEEQRAALAQPEPYKIDLTRQCAKCGSNNIHEPSKDNAFCQDCGVDWPYLPEAPPAQTAADVALEQFCINAGKTILSEVNFADDEVSDEGTACNIGHVLMPIIQTALDQAKAEGRAELEQENADLQHDLESTYQALTDEVNTDKDKLLYEALQRAEKAEAALEGTEARVTTLQNAIDAAEHALKWYVERGKDLERVIMAKAEELPLVDTMVAIGQTAADIQQERKSTVELLAEISNARDAALAGREVV